MHLSQVYSDSYFTDGKDGYPDYLLEQEILIEHGYWYSKIISKYSPPGRMLDVGAAAGFIMLGFKNSGWECTGLEPNQHMVDYGRDQLRLDMKCGYIENINTDEQYDLVSLIQVIGHVFNLDLALQNISKIIKNKGLLLVECWDRGSLAARFQGRKWQEYSPPSVINWFTKKCLNQKINQYGFKLIRQGRPKKRISFKHAISILTNKFPVFKFLCRFLKIILGNKDFFITYPPIDIFYSIYKKEHPENEQKNCFNIA